LGVVSEWTTVRLGDVTDLLTGFPFKSDRYADDDTATRLLRGDNVAQGTLRWNGAKRWPPGAVSDVAEYWVREGDVIVAMDRPWVPSGLKYASVRECDLPALLVQRVARLRGRDRLDTRFLKYVIGSQAFVEHVLAVQTGTAVPHISKDQIESFEFRLPPLPAQRTIAHILGTLDNKIELNRRMNETLEAMARALFKSWFVDFDPVRAKAEGRDPDLPKALSDLFPDSFEDSEMGEIPAGWGVKSIYDVLDVVYGAPFSSSQFNSTGSGRPLVRIRDLPNESPGVCTPEVHTGGYTVRPGDIVVGMDGEFRAYLWGGAEACLNQRVCVFAPKSGYSAAFVRNSIIGPLAQVEATETATTVIHLGKSDIDRFAALVPTQPVLTAFNRSCQPWYDRIVANKQQSRTLATLRDTLLPKLVSGQLHVKDAERFIQEATA
jgi:type I restriction enzyme S subunit